MDYKERDYIFIENLEVFAYHGVLEEEKQKGQKFFLTLKLYLDLTDAGHSDDLDYSVDYADVCHRVTELMNEHKYYLIEAVVDYVTTRLLIEYPLIKGIDVKLSKPEAPIGLPFENVSVNISRGWHTAYIALGSNIGDKETYIREAIEEFDKNPMCRVKTVSDLIVTPPYGYTEQDEFLNGAMEIETLLTPYELLNFAHFVEEGADRVREIHWGPRTLDVDIVFYDDLVTEDKNLLIPHPEMHKREFVLKPLRQIAPYKLHPVLQKRVKDIEICE